MGIVIIIYLTLLIVITFLGNTIDLFTNNNKAKNAFLFISFLPLLLISALRSPSVGADTENYLYGYNLIKDYFYPDFFNVVRWENGYVILNKLVSFMSNNEQIIIIATSFIILIGIFYFIYKNSLNFTFSIYLFLSLYFYLISFNLIRQFIAISILLMGFHLIEKRKFFKYLIVVVIASTFHQPAILMIGLYFLYNLKLNAKNLTLIIGSAILLLVSFNYIMELIFIVFPGYEYYIGTSYLEGSGLLTTLISGSILFFGVFIKLTYKSDKKFDFLLIIMIVSFLVSALSMYITLFNRLGYYFSIFNIIFIPYAIYLVKDQNVKIIYSSVIYIITFLYFLFRLAGDFQQVIPYSFY
ncbi:EpsG family protein [Caldibacillus thermoamylovorans]|uniref:EpsG family protein n=1 Tax=Caldibacillus thermoamylovorans TaxID=35841 RepID=A0ABD4A2C9_9BACI|nr:EpsG family protein [Caldibacillus thermoamylovorans]KIO70372.1 hypothetical protein B4166_1622 [Caldibacillus thermoamylovorans]KIO70540.1 hypothetical protein B4167_3854 [Caldibacillus thermoamylovorans]